MREPAFPLVVPTSYDKATGAVTDQDVFHGMSLRDHFAASLVDPHWYARLLSEYAKKELVGPAPERPRTTTDTSSALVEYHRKLFEWELRLHAKIRYLHAEAMMKERIR